jgi:hypothetical protein
MSGRHKRNTAPMLTSPRCGAKRVRAACADHHRFVAKGAAACMVEHRGQVLHVATRTRESTAGTRARSLRNASKSAIYCGKRAS